MSLTYQADNTRVANFECSSAGADLLCALHKRCGAALHEVPIHPGARPRKASSPSRVPYQATPLEAHQMAAKVRAAGPRLWRSVLEGPDRDLWGGTMSEWVDYVREWIEFLETCDGYQVLQ